MTPEETFLSIGRSLEGAQPGQMFGKPCFKSNGKAFMCFFDNQMVFKLTGDIHQEALNLYGAQLFDPSGKKRPMKEWVQVSFDYVDKWQEFAQEAMNYIQSNL